MAAICPCMDTCGWVGLNWWHAGGSDKSHFILQNKQLGEYINISDCINVFERCLLDTLPCIYSLLELFILSFFQVFIFLVLLYLCVLQEG